MEDSNNETFLLFVTGIPSKTYDFDLEEVFGGLGRFRFARLKKKGSFKEISHGNPLPNLKKGFCILEALDQTSYLNALNNGQLEYLNRTLKINRFQEGQTFEDRCVDEADRKVIIKKVPSQVKKQLLFAALEKEIGKITRMYRFEASHLQKTVLFTDCKYNSYSVEFALKESAILATNIRKLLISSCDIPIVIERFQRKKQIKDKSIVTKLASPRLQNFLLSRQHFKTGGKNKDEILKKDTSITSTNNIDWSSSPIRITDHFKKPTNKEYYSRRRSDIIPQPANLQLRVFTKNLNSNNI